MTDSLVSAPVTLPRPAALASQAAAENFPVASRLLPRRERRHLTALYGFARLVDDLGDELPGTPGDRLAALDAAQAELDRAFAGEAPPAHPVFARLADTIRERSLPRQPFVDLIEANRVDQRVARYETYDDLLGYCRLSANPVGRLVLGVFGEDTPEHVELSDHICTGLQLVEHWQDVAEDAGRGRCYLPQEDLRHFRVPAGEDGVPPASELASPAFVRLLAFETARAAGLLESGAPLVPGLRGWPRVAVAGYLGGGLAQIEAMRRLGYAVTPKAPKAPKLSVASQAMGVLVRAVRGQW